MPSTSSVPAAVAAVSESTVAMDEGQVVVQRKRSGESTATVARSAAEGSDVKLAADVLRLLHGGTYRLLAVSVWCSQGCVHLSGTVGSWYLKQMAQEEARSVPGVVQVTSDIKVVADVVNSEQSS